MKALLHLVLNAFGIRGENPNVTSPVTASSFDWLRIIFGVMWLYDSWTSLSVAHKTEMAQFMGVPMSYPWLHLVVAVIAFVKIAIAVALLSGRGVKVMAWIGVAYGALIWLVFEHGGDFGMDATDAGIGLPYMIAFLYILGVEAMREDPDVSHNSLLALARITFGMLWAYDAFLKFQPYFLTHYLDYLTEAAKSESGWLAFYDHGWIILSQAIGPQVVAWMVALTEAALAASLLLGRGLRVLGPIGLGLAFVIWSVPEKFGGPYSLGVTSMDMGLIGVAVIYMLILGYVWVLYNPLDLRHTSERTARRHATDRSETDKV